MRKGTAINRVDLTNKKFGRLTVIEMLYQYKISEKSKPRTYCKCKCSCGNIKIVSSSNLQKGATKSCGCLEKESRYGRKHFVNLIDKRYGKLVVIEKYHENAPNGASKWICKCDCGNYRIVSSGDLNRGRVTHCGCDNFKSVTLDLTGQRFGYLTAVEPSRKEGVNRTAWKCICDCGNETITTTDLLRSGKTISCGLCNHKKSYHEVFIESLLLDYNVKYFYNYTFENCRSLDKNRKLPFDFYLPELNIIIEYDGEQHVKSIPDWGGDKGLERRKYLDNIKNEYCKNNNINLIRIPHTYNFNEIKKAILNILNPSTTTVA